MPCPACGCLSRRVHGRYERHLADLPWHGLAVALAVQVRRFVCDVPLAAALRDAAALVAPQVATQRLALTLAPCAPVLAARADADKLQQVLLNLLSNAVKFTRPGGAVTLECAATDGQVRVVVRDTGVGIAADQLERVFEPFVTAESAPGAGSTFTLTLPAARGAEPGA